MVQSTASLEKYRTKVVRDERTVGTNKRETHTRKSTTVSKRKAIGFVYKGKKEKRKNGRRRRVEEVQDMDYYVRP